MNRAERRSATKDSPVYPELIVPSDKSHSLKDGDLITVKEPSGYYLSPITGEPQVFKVKIK
jgi:hypothetical protein